MIIIKLKEVNKKNKNKVRKINNILNNYKIKIEREWYFIIYLYL